MKIMDFLSPKAITANLNSETKKAVIEELSDLLVKAGELKDKEKMIKVLIDREALGSTGIGQGVAIPHGKFDGVKKLVAAFGVSRKGVEYDSLDGEKVHIFFLLVAPEDAAGPHLKALARISRLLKDKYFRETLRQTANEQEILKIITQEDAKR
ncbi:MAG: PTS sugar transporter subunit IIA [Candidatus Omnitrophota bacterium]